MPLQSHKMAFKAAEATYCAKEQGKYWEMHKSMMVDQNKHTINYKTGWVVRQDKLKPFTNRVIFDELLDDTRDWQKCETLNFRRKTDGNSEL